MSARHCDDKAIVGESRFEVLEGDGKAVKSRLVKTAGHDPKTSSEPLWGMLSLLRFVASADGDLKKSEPTSQALALLLQPQFFSWLLLTNPGVLTGALVLSPPAAQHPKPVPWPSAQAEEDGGEDQRERTSPLSLPTQPLQALRRN